MKWVTLTYNRSGGRAVDLGGPSVCKGGGGTKIEIKHNSRFLQKNCLSLLIGGPSMSVGGGHALGAGSRLQFFKITLKFLVFNHPSSIFSKWCNA